MKYRLLGLLDDHRSLGLIVAAIGLIALFDLSIFNRYFPLTEGWWEAYGYLINEGLIPYRDFDLAFPPIVPLIYAKALQIVGPDFYLLRLVGVLVHATAALLLVLWLRQYFSIGPAVVAVVFGSFMSMSNSTYIAKDYHAFVDLMLAAALALTAYGTSALNGHASKSKLEDARAPVSYLTSLLAMLAAGVAVALLALIKQNIGILFGAGLVVGALMFLPLKKGLAMIGVALVGAVAAFFSTQLMISGWGLAEVLNLTTQNDAKGSIFSVLTRALTDPINRNVIVSTVLLFYVFLFVKGILRIAVVREVALSLGQPYLGVKGTAWLFGTSVAILLFIYWGMFLLLVIPAALAIMLTFLVDSFSRSEARDRASSKIAVFLPALLLLAYANTNTASFNFAGMYIPIVFATAVVAERFPLTPVALRTSLIVLGSILCIVVSRKWAMPYEWWGYEQASIFQAKHETSYPELESIYVDKDTDEAFSLINRVVNEHSLARNDVLFYPSIPIFYLLNNKLPPYKSVVQWFDVITDKQAAAMLQEFTHKPPRVIVFLDPPDFVYEGHAELRRGAVVQSDMRAAILNKVRQNEYRLVATQVMEKKLRQKNQYATSAMTVEILNDKVVGKGWASLCGVVDCDPSQTLITSWRRKNGTPVDITNAVLERGDLVSFVAKEQTINRIVESSGLQAIRQNRYLLQILVQKNTK